MIKPLERVPNAWKIPPESKKRTGSLCDYNFNAILYWFQALDNLTIQKELYKRSCIQIYFQRSYSGFRRVLSEREWHASENAEHFLSQPQFLSDIPFRGSIGKNALKCVMW